MQEITTSITQAIELLMSLDEEIYSIIGLSLVVSCTSTLLSTLVAVPFGTVLGTHDFPLKKIVIRLIYTFMSLPPVIAGLLVFLMIMRKGPLGSLQLSFTPTAMIIAQTLIVIPIITGITYNGVVQRGPKIKALAKTLGANKHQSLRLLIYDMRLVMIAAIITGFGRAVSEVGAVMIVGGNIKGHTRVMTTYIAMLQNMGNYSKAIAIGIVLLSISFIINGIMYNLQQK